MKNPKLWAFIVFFLGILTFIAFFLPQFQIVIWESGEKSLIYAWGGHSKVGATVSPLLYVIANLWGGGAVLSLMWAGYKLREPHRSAVAWMNWAAFFLAMELIFLLVVAEEVLTDLRILLLHADSLAASGSWLSFIVLILLLFLPGRVKKSLFRPSS
ncbi:MAG: hypothetical protein RMK19_00040 [Bacteroidia bacterium]|nr:hypothetical protein [Bacteroidia bacterium]MDW8014389.1 hypothetical protein [Bacteroidia bacterium]